MRIGGKLQPCMQMQAANTFMKKRRAGVAEPAGGLEAYFIPPGALSDAMLQVRIRDGDCSLCCPAFVFFCRFPGSRWSWQPCHVRMRSNVAT